MSNLRNVRRLALAAPLLLSLSGCALLAGGKTAAEKPGFEIQVPNFWRAGKLAITSDANLRARKLTVSVPLADGRVASFEAHDLEYGQAVVAAIDAEARKVRAIGQLHEAVGRGVANVVASVGQAIATAAPALSPLMAALAAAEMVTTERGLQLTLPGGFSIGGTTVTRADEARAILTALAEAARAAPGAESRPSE
ncbi:hypothetical protein RAS1_14340 [Phycisphaerae bacterium RAS1]|nr:hypothetical protein RAS1_14340 [Phycisphaerae bacterium RAS1]